MELAHSNQSHQCVRFEHLMVYDEFASEAFKCAYNEDVRVTKLNSNMYIFSSIFCTVHNDYQVE